MSVALVPQKPAPPLALKRPLDAEITKQQKAAILLSVLIGAGATPDLDQIETASLKNIVDIMASFGEDPNALNGACMQENITCPITSSSTATKEVTASPSVRSRSTNSASATLGNARTCNARTSAQSPSISSLISISES